MQLAELQEKFRQAVLERELTPFVPWIAAGGISVEERLAVYRVNILENNADALKDTFPAVCALVGEEFFRAMAKEFVRAHPPQEACLLWYGGGFADFIAAFAPASSVPYLADVARFEWAWHSACFAEDDEPLEPGVLEAMSEEELQKTAIGLRAGAELVTSRFPVDTLWRYAKSPEEEPMPEPDAAGGYWLIWRSGREMMYKLLNHGEHAALAILANGGTLRQAMETAEQHGMDAAELLAGILQLRILRQPDILEK